MSEKPEVKKRERFQKVGSVNYKENKEHLLGRARKGLLLTFEAMTTKLEAGKPLRDEEIRFMKNFSSTLKTMEAREELEEEKTEGLVPGKLKEFVEGLIRFLDATGYADPRKDGLPVMKGANYMLCEFCGEFHKILDSCPFKVVAEKRKEQLTVEKEEAEKDPNRPIDLTKSD
ncbi:hypothetical protein MUO83_03660 [Candidatus Bathyarchaeota archaeon]|nr:hypothetical protein [Candidatus Bathyarchaeota archaeon]